MTELQKNNGLMPSLLLLAALVAAQFGTLMHSDRHDAGTAQDQTCPMCVTASQLASACVSEPPELDLDVPSCESAPAVSSVFLSRHDVPARQRGPPAVS